jgi:hypothetical protein
MSTISPRKSSQTSAIQGLNSEPTFLSPCYIPNINTLTGLYNLEYFSAAVLISLIVITPLITNQEIKLWLQNYAVIITIEKLYQI